MSLSAPIRDVTGKTVGAIRLKESVFGVPMNQAVVHQALLWQRANARQGTSDTKTRGEVSGTTRKPYPQKHTGRARAGMRKSPLWRHGGIIFGPKPRDYTQRMPRKMRRLAIRCLLSDKQAAGDLAIVKEFTLAEGKTKEMTQALTALGVAGSALVVTLHRDDKIVRAAANLPSVHTIPVSVLNVGDLLRHRHLVMTVDSVRWAEQHWDGTPIDRKRVPAEAAPAKAAGLEPVAVEVEKVEVEEQEAAKAPGRAKAIVEEAPAKAEVPPVTAQEEEAPARPKRIMRKSAPRTRSARKKSES